MFALLQTGTATAQLRSQYFAPETFAAPDRLAPVGAAIEPVSTVYYLRDFSEATMKLQEVRINPGEGFAGSVYVKFESDVVNAAINAALESKGIRLAKTMDDADISITGQALYRVHLMPYLQRQLRLDTKFDQFKKSVSIADADSKKMGTGDALISVGGSAANAVANPAEFIGRLIQATMDLAGATSALERSAGWDLKQRQEQSITFGDCYDNATRAATCPAGGTRNNAYSFRTRFQYVDFKTFVQQKGKEARRFNLISRVIDGRNETRDDMATLLSAAIQELTAGFPSQPQGQEQLKDDTAAPAK